MEFKKFYNEKGYCPNQISHPKNPLNEKQLKSAFLRYQKSEIKKLKRKEILIENIKLKIENTEKLLEKIHDPKLEEVYQKVNKRDKNKCRFISLLNIEEMYVLKSLSWKELLDTVEHAHIFPKSVYPKLKYEALNIILLNRYSHSLLDQYRNPISGEQISKQEQINWWKKIAGQKQWQELIKIKENFYGKK